MKKKIKNSKGFAMAELLAVCIIVLGIFSMLFANYLPLLAEYENRISYNNVTAQYASHYIRKMYKEALEDPEIQKTFKTITQNNPKLTVYTEKDKDNSKIYDHIDAVTSNKVSWSNNSEAKKNEIKSLIEVYGIEEIAITKYVLTDAKENYKKDGLKNYLKYLPEYKNSIYTGANAEENKELYRLLIKTKNYGYATTPILSDYKTPVDCFTGKRVTGGIIITSYKNENELCTTDVTIGSNSINISNGDEGRVSGQVVGIGKEAFKDKGLTSITFPKDQIKTIEDGAFTNNPNLQTFDFSSITSIGDSAFSNTGLTEVVLSDTTRYGDSVFANCDNLNKVTINTDITNLGNSLFAKEENNSSEGLDITINGLKNIPNNMFQNSKINKITLLKVEKIGANAFKNVTSATDTGLTLNIPASVTSIGESSFAGATIESLTFNSSNGQLTIGNNAFNKAKITGGLSIPKNIKAIGNNAFNATGINSLTFEQGATITTIGSGAFQENKLATLDLPNSLTTIGSKAFSNNSKLKEIILPTNNEYNTISEELFSGNTSLTSLTIPDNIKTIGNKAFYNNSALQILEIPSNVTSIGNGAFTNCPLLGTTEENPITNNSNSEFNWCNIFYSDEPSSCTVETEGVNTYVKYPELQDKLIIKGGVIENEQ